MENSEKEEFKKQIKNICKEYEFKYRELSDNNVSLCARNSDKKWIEWIEFDFGKGQVSILGNTDQCNLWFYDTRKDMTPEKIVSFVGNLNNIFRKFNHSYVTVDTLIDPEDWQEIANVHNAYEDVRYKIRFMDVAFADNENKYIYFTISDGEHGPDSYYGIDGIFRIHDLANGADMKICCVYNCCTEYQTKFIDAHFEEIEEELRNFAEQRQKNEEEEI